MSLPPNIRPSEQLRVGRIEFAPLPPVVIPPPVRDLGLPPHGLDDGTGADEIDVTSFGASRHALIAGLRDT